MTIGKVIGNVNGVDVLVGSTWKTVNGEYVDIEEKHPGESTGWPIKGVYNSEEWNTFTCRGTFYYNGESKYDLKELVMNPVESTPEVKQVSYTEDQIREAWYILDYQPLGLTQLIQHLKNTYEPEYQKYLELKAKFEGKE